MDRIALKLAYPIVIKEFGDETTRLTSIDTLNLAPRIKGRHLKAADHAEGPVSARLAVYASLANITRSEVDELDEADLEAIDGVVNGNRSDLRRIALALGLGESATVDAMLAVIAGGLRGAEAPEGRPDPLDLGGAGATSPADGLTNGPTLSPG